MSAWGLKGVSRRGAFVIGREGTIRYSYVCPEPSDLPDFEEIKKCLRGIS
jgi:glutaredoxin-dependent peroxiredoxin